MKIIYIEDVCHDDVGGVQGVMDENGKCIGLWAASDGDWRHEYFNSFMKKLGFEVRYGKYENELVKAAAEVHGIKLTND